MSYLDGPNETYTLPVRIAHGDEARNIAQSAPQAVIARFNAPGDPILHDAIWNEEFRTQLFNAIRQQQRLKGLTGDLVGIAGRLLSQNSSDSPGSSHVVSGEQSNSSMVFDNKFFLKLYRKLEDGVNPDVEVTRFLTDQAGFPNVPAFGGALEFVRGKSEPTVICLLQSAVANENDAWSLTLDAVGRFYERVLARKADVQDETAVARRVAPGFYWRHLPGEG